MSSDSPRPAPVAGVAEMAQDMASGPDVEAPPKGPPPGSPHHRTRYGLPRVLIIVVGLAAGLSLSPACGRSRTSSARCSWRWC